MAGTLIDSMTGSLLFCLGKGDDVVSGLEGYGGINSSEVDSGLREAEKKGRNG